MITFELQGRHFRLIGPERLTEARLIEIETELGFTLPHQIRQYYLKYNGGYPRPLDIPQDDGVAVRVKWDLQTQSEAAKHASVVLVGETYLFDSANESSDLMYRWRRAKNITKGMFQFAQDPGGDAFLIGVAPENLGKIYYWATERDWKYGEGAPIASPEFIGLVANSFVEFLLAYRTEPSREEWFAKENWIKRNYED